MAWHFYPAEKPPMTEPGEARNYPVALYDPEIGIINDIGEYHATFSEPWVTMDGYVIHPYAWYDLPDPPQP
jgi:hypothetical protein